MLSRQLIVFDRQEVIIKWHDRQIPPGTKWKDKIDSRLRKADIVLLFVSPHFFESDYCFDVEMREALRRHASRKCQSDSNYPASLSVAISPLCATASSSERRESNIDMAESR